MTGVFGANRRESTALVLAGWIFPADLVLLPTSDLFSANRREGECVGAGGMDFSGGVTFAIRLHPACLCKTAREYRVGAGGMDFSGGVNFTGCLHPACLCKPGREGNALGQADGFFPADLILPTACLRCVCNR